MSYLDHPFLEWPSDGHACSTPRCPCGEHVGRLAATGPTILHSTKCLSITAQRKDAPSELLNMQYNSETLGEEAPRSSRLCLMQEHHNP